MAALSETTTATATTITTTTWKLFIAAVEFKAATPESESVPLRTLRHLRGRHGSRTGAAARTATHATIHTIHWQAALPQALLHPPRCRRA